MNFTHKGREYRLVGGKIFYGLVEVGSFTMEQKYQPGSIQETITKLSEQSGGNVVRLVGKEPRRD
jgi:hypothetical protein